MGQAVTITFVPQQVITWLIIGLLAGFLASLVVRGRGMSTLGSLIIGLVGALVGGVLFTLLAIDVSPALKEGITIRYIDVIVAFLGAVFVLVITAILRGRRS